MITLVECYSKTLTKEVEDVGIFSVKQTARHFLHKGRDRSADGS